MKYFLKWKYTIIWTTNLNERQKEFDRLKLTPTRGMMNNEWRWLYVKHELNIFWYAKMVIIFLPFLSWNRHLLYIVIANCLLYINKLPAQWCIQIPKLWKMSLFSRFSHICIFFLLFMHSMIKTSDCFKSAPLIFTVQDHSDTKYSFKHQRKCTFWLLLVLWLLRDNNNNNGAFQHLAVVCCDLWQNTGSVCRWHFGIEKVALVN